MALRVHVALACLLPKAQLSLVCFVCVFVCVCVLRVLHVFECTQLVCGGISYVVPFYLVTNCVCVCVCVFLTSLCHNIVNNSPFEREMSTKLICFYSNTKSVSPLPDVNVSAMFQGNRVIQCAGTHRLLCIFVIIIPNAYCIVVFGTSSSVDNAQ